MKQTAVEWLVTELNQKIDYIPMKYWDEIRDLVQQAKQMEKHQIITGYYIGFEIGYGNGGYNNEPYYDDPEIYYNETYGKE